MRSNMIFNEGRDVVKLAKDKTIAVTISFVE